jgi:Trk K+ transport system NAD-binding subunit
MSGGAAYEDWSGHVIVCGLRGPGLRVVEQLRQAGEQVVVIDDDPDPRLARVVTGWGVPHLAGKAALTETLVEAGLHGAIAVVCVEETDLQNLEISLLARETRPDVRIVTHVRNSAVGRALAVDPGPGMVLEVAALAAPSIVEACTGATVHELTLGGERFLVTGTRAHASGTLRELYGNEVMPLAVSGAGPLAICPSRDHKVEQGAPLTVAGTPAQLAEHGLPGPEAHGARHGAGERPRRLRLWSRQARLRLPSPGAVLEEAGPGMRRALTVLGLIITVSTLVLWHGYAEPGMSMVDGLYFSIETIATVGFGDFSFADQPMWLRIYAIILMIVGVGTTAVLLAYLTDLLVSRRLERSSGRRLVARMSGHVLVVGLGTVGAEVMRELRARDRDVVVIERDDESPFLEQARDLGVPVIFGDATVPSVLTAGGLDRASAVAVLTSDDMVNIEAALAVRDVLGDRWHQVRVVPRIFDRHLARTLSERFGFRNVRSTAELAAPWFVGAALGLDVLATFTAQDEPFLAGRLTVAPDSGLAGRPMRHLSEHTWVVAIGRDGGETEHLPRRAAGLNPGDQAYLIGPYEEILRVLQHGRAKA